jgi:hypothetical protein
MMKFFSNRSGLLFAIGFVILIPPEILKMYFIMPMPGSQQQNNVELAYALNKFIWLSRIAGGILFVFAALEILKSQKLWKKIVAVSVVILSAVILWLTNFVISADRMFLQPGTKIMRQKDENKIEDERLVIGVELNGEAKAYPVHIIGYHHQVRDTVGGQQVMVTYCTVCRTGRVYKPQVNGKLESFRLVGMDQFNAMFEDATTKSWWRQATGECCAGPLKGSHLTEIYSQQMTLAAWKDLYPATYVLQPDPEFDKEYADLKGFDDGTNRNFLTGTDTSSFRKKSWVIGIAAGGAEKIYDWNLLKRKRIIQDSVGSEPIVLLIKNDNKSFYAFSRKENNEVRNFRYDSKQDILTDSSTSHIWKLKGECVSDCGHVMKLKPVWAYQEFYHSFTAFHPGAVIYK